MSKSVGFVTYDCIKQVQAAEIIKVGDEGCRLKVPAATPEEADGWVYREFKPNMTARHRPSEGDFWVIYADDYESISPRHAFLAGYMPAAPVAQEPLPDPVT
ncbi:hypothetical protein UFOVP99_16 [uncultured Caudovirales phage]|uniref:Uncharacterized protein n=1 Tax=uncultured Caudovirales phage TaxID=2100421 RepID=A0A6J5L3N7_9CAUD|nr:hypothetical protein UFOVP99_16 [uncultured Caudovirales phage]